MAIIGIAPAHTPPSVPYLFDPNNHAANGWVLEHTSRGNMIELSSSTPIYRYLQEVPLGSPVTRKESRRNGNGD